MSSKVVRTKVETYLRANWVTTDILGEENEIDQPPSDITSLWLSFGFQSFGEQERSIGVNTKICYQETGLVYVNVWVPTGRGSDTALTHAESIRTLMRHQNLGDGVRLGTAAPPQTAIPSQTQSSSGNWFAYQVAIDYRYDYMT